MRLLRCYCLCHSHAPAAGTLLPPCWVVSTNRRLYCHQERPLIRRESAYGAEETERMTHAMTSDWEITKLMLGKERERIVQRFQVSRDRTDLGLRAA